MCNLAAALGAGQRLAFADEAIGVTSDYRNNLTTIHSNLKQTLLF